MKGVPGLFLGGGQEKDTIHGSREVGARREKDSMARRRGCRKRKTDGVRVKFSELKEETKRRRG